MLRSIGLVLVMLIGCAATPELDPKPVPPVVAYQPCNSYGVISSDLRERWGEHLEFIGHNQRILFSVFIHNKTGSWTITVTDPNKTCIWATGQGWTRARQNRGPRL